jgi:hypothetical protein
MSIFLRKCSKTEIVKLTVIVGAAVVGFVVGRRTVDGRGDPVGAND